MKWLIGGMVLFMGLATQVTAQVLFDTHTDSKLWLEGSSTIHRFDCVARSIDGSAFIKGYPNDVPARVNGNDQPDLHVHIRIPIRSFDCGHSRMNRDMYEALKSDEYDYITFDFEQAERVEGEASRVSGFFEEDYHTYRIRGVLNIAGVEREVSMVIGGRPDEQGRYRIRGEKKISMNDYDVEPPTALRGLIRAHDNLTVFFDLIVIEQQT
ncbi:MAG: YceI family protein [Balneolales bacterium]